MLGVAPTTVRATRADGVTTVAQTLSFTPQSDAVFEGQLRKAVIATTVTVSGGRSLSESRVSYFSTNPFMLHGDQLINGSNYTVTSPRVAGLPTTATAGDSGPFFSSVTYADSSKSTVLGITEATWSLEALTGDTTKAYLCVNLRVTDYTRTGRPVTDGAVCYLIDGVGQLLGLRTKIVFDGEPLDLR